jgi:hypothetical protein
VPAAEQTILGDAFRETGEQSFRSSRRTPRAFDGEFGKMRRQKMPERKQEILIGLLAAIAGLTSACGTKSTSSPAQPDNRYTVKDTPVIIADGSGVLSTDPSKLYAYHGSGWSVTDANGQFVATSNSTGSQWLIVDAASDTISESSTYGNVTIGVTKNSLSISGPTGSCSADPKDATTITCADPFPATIDGKGFIFHSTHKPLSSAGRNFYFLFPLP